MAVTAWLCCYCVWPKFALVEQTAVRLGALKGRQHERISEELRERQLGPLCQRNRKFVRIIVGPNECKSCPIPFDVLY